MSELVNGEEKKFTPLELRLKRSIRVYFTPNKGRDAFTVSYYDENGKRQRRVFADRQVAKAEAEELCRHMNKGVAPGLLISGRERLIYERAFEAARAAGQDLDILTKEAAEARRLLGNASIADAARFFVEHRIKVTQRLVNEVVKELIEDRVNNGKSPVYIRDLRTRLGNFAEAFKCPISSVEWKDIDEYLKTTGASGRYRKNLICSVGTLFNFARNRNYVHRDHPGVKPITKPADTPSEKRLFIPAEGRKLLLGLPARLIPSAAVGLFTPIRTAEIERLDWCHVNLKEGHIEIKARNAKKRIRRIVPIPPNLKLWLSPFAKAFGKVCPFTRLTNQWNKFAVRAGVRWSRNVHRDSGISYTVALKRNVAEVSLISGNSPEVIRNNYLKCVTLEQAKAWFAIRPPKDWKPKREPQLKMLTKKIPT